ncbi:N-acetylglutamate synthase [Microdochium nivale]|nr:N-acetylglutamate synthase [Microdochium nivale]
MMEAAEDALPAPAALPAGYTMQEGYPPLPEYLNLRKASGLTPVSPEQGKMVPRGSWYGVYITVPGGGEEGNNDDNSGQDAAGGNGGHDSTASTDTPPRHTARKAAVAMGRIIGDGGWYFVIADIAVLPAHQRRGLGDAIVKALVARVRSHGAEGQAYITLTADPPGRKLYASNGFRDSMPAGMGMHRLLQVPGAGGDVEEVREEGAAGGGGGGSR